MEPIVGGKALAFATRLWTKSSRSDLSLALEDSLPVVAEAEELEQFRMYAWQGRQILQPFQADPGCRPGCFTGKQMLTPLAAADEQIGPRRRLGPGRCGDPSKTARAARAVVGAQGVEVRLVAADQRDLFARRSSSFQLFGNGEER